MNAKEQSQITDLITSLDKHNIKINNKIEKILTTLEDDPKSNNVGLISRVNDLNHEVEKLRGLSVGLKRIGGAVATALTIIGGFLLNKYK